MCNPCNNSILGSNPVCQESLESSLIDCDRCIIVENVSCLGDNADNTDDFTYVGFYAVESGLDSFVTFYIVNDLKLFIPKTIVELQHKGMKGIGGTVVIPLKGDVEIHTFCSGNKK